MSRIAVRVVDDPTRRRIAASFLTARRVLTATLPGGYVIVWRTRVDYRHVEAINRVAAALLKEEAANK